MAAARRYPLRINDTVDAACARVRAGMFAEGVSVSSVTKVWAASAGRGTAATVVAFILRNSSNRRERRQRRSEARAAAFRARRRAGVAIEEARAAGEEYARELVAFARTAEGAPSSFRAPGTGELQDAAPPLAEHLTGTEEAAGGISLERLPAEDSAARVLQRCGRAWLARRWRARRFALRHRFARVLQRWWRASRYATKNRCALVLQRWWRASRVGTRCRGALAIQRWWRSRFRRVVRLGLVEAAALAATPKVLKIQSFWRGRRLRRAWQWRSFAGCERLPSMPTVLAFCVRFLVPAAALLSHRADASAINRELGSLWLDARRALESLEVLDGTVWNIEKTLEEAVWNALRALRGALGIEALAKAFYDIKVEYLAAQRTCWCGTCALCFRSHRESCAALGYSEEETEASLRAELARAVQLRKAAAGAAASS